MTRYTTLAASLTLALLTALPSAQAAQPLSLSVFMADSQSLFPVSSEIITGEHDAILIDAQFQRNDAQALVQKLQNSGKTLTTIYISHSDPDYYFGLDTLQAAFPQARIVATAPTVEAIKASMAGKLAYWGPILKDNAPTHLVLPEVLKGERLQLEGKTLEIKGLHGPDRARSYVWIPSLKTVVGGVLVSSGIHVWVADTQTAQSRQHWQKSLAAMRALHPATVVPAHFRGEMPNGVAAIQFTADYLKAFDAEARSRKDSQALTQAMTRRYPALGDVESLELSAKVVKGEMKWPQ